MIRYCITSNDELHRGRMLVRVLDEIVALKILRSNV
jgi:hypothetical protein